MAEATKISWATSTFNPVRGCVEVSPACDHCYAREMAKRNPAILGVWGHAGTRVVAAVRQWQEPLKWDAAAGKAGERRRVFCASLADIFEDWPGRMVDSQGNVLWFKDERICSAGKLTPRLLPGDRPATMDDARGALFTLIQNTPNLDWLLLTKRPENVEPILRRITDTVEGRETSLWAILPTLKNVWIGTTVENQEQAEKRIPILNNIPAAVRFLSVEPMLGPIDLTQLRHNEYQWNVLSGEISYLGVGTGPNKPTQAVQWLICGGESGPNARPFKVEWARSLREQCRKGGVPFFLKQLGAKPCTDNFGGPFRAGGFFKLKDSHGGDPSEWPEDLRVRELPEVVLA